MDADPFGILGDLAAPTPRHTSAAVPTPPARPAAILDDLYGPTPPAASSPKLSGGFLPQAQSGALPQSLGMGGAAGASSSAGGAHAAANLLGSLDLGGPPAASGASSRSSAQPAGAKGVGPMAPRGNAAVEQQAGKRDPFADLFS